MICVICGENKHNYLYMLRSIPLWQCTECGLVSSQLHFSEENILENYDNKNESFPVATEGRTETEASRRYIEILKTRTPNVSRVILLAKENHVFSKIAPEYGLHVIQHLTVSSFEREIFTEESVDAIIFLYQLEKSLLPQNALNKAHDLLKPGGTLLVVTPSLDSRSARFFRNAWTEWRPENIYYFDDTTIQSLLWKHGFNEVQLDKDLRWYTLAHINDRAVSFPKTWITRSIHLAYRILPTSFHGTYFRLPTSGRVITAKKYESRKRQVLSIVLPVYNESSTFPELITQLISKQIECVDKEIIIVESNSTDNSRQLVMEYKDHPEVKIILQDRARGKGYAVREGFEHASGDILMIQDADLEYDLNDYESLLKPVVAFKRPFVLGSRHGGRWKMRHFSEEEHISAYFNFGHKLFTTLINVLYGQEMKDPFTMFKVFRQDCIYNLKFECNRFDFDFELVIKLIRKGYTPLEIPVNYNSRSFKEGKKVNMFRDPLTWIKASFKYRFVKITKD
jgi:SAM-dependent methyltransferase